MRAIWKGLAHLFCALGLHSWAYDPVTHYEGFFVRRRHCAGCGQVRLQGWTEWQH